MLISYSKHDAILQIIVLALKNRARDSYSDGASACEKWHLTLSHGWKWISKAYFSDGKHLDLWKHWFGGQKVQTFLFSCLNRQGSDDIVE